MLYFTQLVLGESYTITAKILPFIFGAVTVGTWTETNVSTTITEYSHNLTAGELANLTDGSILKLKFGSA